MRRLLGSLAVLAVASAATFTWVVRPVVADRAVLSAERLLKQAIASRPPGRIRLARAGVAEARRAIAADPLRVDGWIDAGYGSLLAGDAAGAVHFYRGALRVDRRPEIYAGLALAELAAGERQRALRHYAVAIAVRPAYLRVVPRELRSDARRLAGALEANAEAGSAGAVASDIFRWAEP